MLKVYTVDDFPGFYPVGFAAIIVAKDEVDAHHEFKKAVEATGLSMTDKFGVPIKYTLVPRKLLKPTCVILCDGNY